MGFTDVTYNMGSQRVLLCHANTPPSSEEQVCDLSPHFDWVMTKSESLGKFTFNSVLSHHNCQRRATCHADAETAKTKATNDA